MSTATISSLDYQGSPAPPQLDLFGPPPVRAEQLDSDLTTSQQPSTQASSPVTERLRTTMAAVKVAFTWFGVRRALAPEQRSTAAQAFQADCLLLSASKLILDIRAPAYRKVARVRSEASAYWRCVTLPYPEPGIRLLDQNSLGLFANTMAAFRDQLHTAAGEFAAAYQQMKAEARWRLGTLFNDADYPATLEGLFDLEVSYPPLEPPRYLVALSPDLYREEQARVRTRFESAIDLAEQAFAGELSRLMKHLAERLSGTTDGRPRIFRDTAISNIREFIERFERLNVRSSQQLDALVDQARATVAGLAPSELRSSGSLRESVARDARAIESAVDVFMADRPRRTILRRGSGGQA